MNNEFFEALELIAKEKGISADPLLERVKTAVALAVKKDFGGVENINVDIDSEKQKFKVSVTKEVVDEITDPANQLTLEQALKVSKRAAVGKTVNVKLDTKHLGRIAAQSAKHVIKQGIREAERAQMLEQFNEKLHKVVVAFVYKVDPVNHNATLIIDGNEIVFFKNDQIPGEELKLGKRLKVYVSDVIASERHFNMKVSRTHRNFVKQLFMLEVPEVANGIIEIKNVSREAGSRSKVAVFSSEQRIDPVGSCIGPKGNRINRILEELAGEKIDLIKYSDDPAEFIAAALAPANVLSVEILDEVLRSAKVIVPDHQLSLAIGNRGQNAKLAARLTNWKIDLHPESGFFSEIAEV